MNNERRKKESYFLIGGGILCQVAGLLGGELFPGRYWPLLFLPAIGLLAAGYHAGMRSRGYDSLRSRWLYAMTVVSLLIPVIGPIGAIQRLSLMGKPGEKPDARKKTMATLVTFGVAVVIVAVLIMLSWPTMAYYRKGVQVREHLQRSRDSIELARRLREAGKEYYSPLTTAESELYAARRLAVSFGYSSSDGSMFLCSGDIHLLQGRFADAERDYESALQHAYLKEAAAQRLLLKKERKKAIGQKDASPSAK